MKKILMLLTACAVAYGVNAQKTEVPKTDKKDVHPIAKPADVDDHKGHNHGPVISMAKDGKNLAADVLELKELVYDFGKIPQGKPVTHVFEVVNKGKEPLKLDNVQASCGCTTPEWDHEAIPAGATSKITVGYNAYSEGAFDKTSTITFGTQSKQMRITGTVWKAPAASAPQNQGLAGLKN
jgi:Protein of unknown function (DUF1573)